MTYTLYAKPLSGNCYKPRLLMAQLGLPYRLIDMAGGKTQAPEFLALNPMGQVPLLVLPDGSLLSESNAMLLFLAEGTPFLPADRYRRALVHQWLFFEQNTHEPSVAVARAWQKTHPELIGKATPEQIANWHKRGNKALAVMERALTGSDWLAGDAYSVADIALYAYTHVAEDGGFDLSAYPAIGAWLTRVAARPGHVGLDWRPDETHGGTA